MAPANLARRGWSLVLAVGLVTGLHGYVVMVERGTGSVWNPGQVFIEFLFGPSPMLQDGGTWNDSAHQALEAWNESMTVLELVGAPGSGPAGTRDNGKNEAFFSATVFGQTFGPNTAAVTLVTRAGWPRERNQEADVIFNSAFAWDSYRGARQQRDGAPLLDFHRVALHEFICWGWITRMSTIPPANRRSWTPPSGTSTP